ncbi:3'-5' exonuclease [Thermus thermamylovorans]|uniref:DNA polymerase III subunit epsilon n=1 Tax=Thermus thermamylovorans TaxID=2509362 RepID=A0A4V2IV97_9DEIN|nr:3'-5' exonuclease [Thermus thermamylovorans]TBH21455.1 DNA polymerase III subunit epsilon [Thermus thermamylovorans]
MREALRFLGALLLGLLLVGGAVGLGLFLLLQGEEALGRELLRVAGERFPALLFVGALFVLVLAALLYPLFLGYLAATRALGQEAEVLLANPAHRLRLRGPFELQALAGLINRLAAHREALEKEVEARVREAKALLEGERQRLAALIGHLPQGVVLATPRGQVLLYNAPARRLLGEGLGAGKSLFGLLDRGLLVHALALPEERFLAPGPKGLLQIQAVPLEGEGGFLLLLEEAQEGGGPEGATLHRLKDKLAGLKALVEALGSETLPEGLKPLLRTARATAEELSALAARLEAPPRAAEVRAEDLLSLLAQALEREAGVSPGLALEEEAKGLLVRADTYALVRGLAATLREEEEVFLQGERAGGLLRLTLTLPHPIPDPHPSLEEAVERAEGSLWREGFRLHLLLPAREAPRLPPREGPPPRAEVFDLSLLAIPEELEEAPLEGLLYTAFDLETTGLDPEKDAIIALGAVHLLGRRVLRQETFEALVDPGRPIPRASTEIHGLTWEMLQGKPRLEEVLPGFRAFLEDTVLLAHNGAFDMAFLRRAGVDQPPLVDTLLLSHLLFPDLQDHRLERLAERFGVPVLGRHTALGDALMTAEVFARMVPLLRERGYRTLGEVLRDCARLPLAGLRY